MKQQILKNQHPKTMLAALAELPLDGAMKSVAYHFLKTPFAQLDSEQDFKKAYHGLLVAQQCLGPLHPGYQRSLIEMRKALDQFGRDFKYSRCRECAACLQKADRFWTSVLEFIAPHVSTNILKGLQQLRHNALLALPQESDQDRPGEE